MTKKLYWGELHNHNEIGYGEGSLDRSYEIAKGLLDVYAFVPHGFWPDLPRNDPKVADYHLNEFDNVSVRYPEVIEYANKNYKPGEFVTLIAYEWHSSAWGDYQVIFPGDSGELFRAKNLKELQAFAEKEKAILIPHHCAYRKGWRGTNWDAWKKEHSPVTEIFSEHGSSFEIDSVWPMVLHSMGGACHTQTVLNQLKNGKVMGFTAGTDNHYGHPASYGEGLTGIYSEDLTREKVMDALWKRHTYAVSGDRIEVYWGSENGMMGDVLESSCQRKFNYDVKAFAPIDSAKILKNGNVVEILYPEIKEEDSGEYVFKIEWGWDAMDQPYLTDWKINVQIVDGCLGTISPGLGGGSGSWELINTFDRINDSELNVRSFTSRKNPLAQSSVTLNVKGGGQTKVLIDVQSKTEGRDGGFKAEVFLEQLLKEDIWGAVENRFSSPKICINKAWHKSDLCISGEWKDENPSENDFYLIKVQQTNGQMAWSSPMFFGN